jgi:hypothetical protein
MDSQSLEKAAYFDGTCLFLKIEEGSGCATIYRVPWVDPVYAEFNASSINQCMALMNICSPTLPESSPLVKIRRTLSRLEDPSHILAWTTSECELNDVAPIDIIDMPRLNLEFRPGPSPFEDGKFVLNCTSFSGYFVCDLQV